MSPFVRGRIIPEVESAGPAKVSLDVLLWLPRIWTEELRWLDLVEVLRTYLTSIIPAQFYINFWVPSHFVETAQALTPVGIRFRTTAVAKPNDKVSETLKGAPGDLLDAAATGLAVDADVVVVANRDWFPYAPEFDKMEMLLADCGVLLRQCEIFVRGRDVPWSFDYMAWNEPWTAFYQMVENNTFHDGFVFLEECQKKKVDAETQDAARMLIHNRLPNLCFTRDRLLFYNAQQSAARRAGWERQEFVFEAAYYLNFYYLLLYGGFDHLALVVNGVLSLGVPPRSVGATYDSFLKPLQAQAPEIHTLFTSAEFTEFEERTAVVRHFAAHRGTIMPGAIYETPAAEPSVEELDEEITRLRLDDFLRYVPDGPLKDAFRENLRFKVRLSKYKRVVEGALKIEIKGKPCFIVPMNDVEWNFSKFHRFMVDVLQACLKRM